MHDILVWGSPFFSSSCLCLMPMRSLVDQTKLKKRKILRRLNWYIVMSPITMARKSGTSARRSQPRHSVGALVGALGNAPRWRVGDNSV
jgi:hypothetical protein